MVSYILNLFTLISSVAYRIVRGTLLYILPSRRYILVNILCNFFDLSIFHCLPLLGSVRAIHRRDTDDYHQWVTYYLLLYAIAPILNFIGVTSFVHPIMRRCFILWLSLPRYRGSLRLYSVIRCMIIDRYPTIEETVDENVRAVKASVRRKMWIVVSSLCWECLSGVGEVVMYIRGDVEKDDLKEDELGGQNDGDDEIGGQDDENGINNYKSIREESSEKILQNQCMDKEYVNEGGGGGENNNKKYERKRHASMINNAHHSVVKTLSSTSLATLSSSLRSRNLNGSYIRDDNDGEGDNDNDNNIDDGDTNANDARSSNTLNGVVRDAYSEGIEAEKTEEEEEEAEFLNDFIEMLSRGLFVFARISSNTPQLRVFSYNEEDYTFIFSPAIPNSVNDENDQDNTALSSSFSLFDVDIVMDSGMQGISFLGGRKEDKAISSSKSILHEEIVLSNEEDRDILLQGLTILFSVVEGKRKKKLITNSEKMVEDLENIEGDEKKIREEEEGFNKDNKREGSVTKKRKVIETKVDHNFYNDDNDSTYDDIDISTYEIISDEDGKDKDNSSSHEKMSNTAKDNDITMNNELFNHEANSSKSCDDNMHNDRNEGSFPQYNDNLVDDSYDDGNDIYASINTLLNVHCDNKDDNKK